MIEIKGKYNIAKIFTDIVDEASISQVLQLCNQEFAKDSCIRLMPDVHMGASCTVGTTMTITHGAGHHVKGVSVGHFSDVMYQKNSKLSLIRKGFNAPDLVIIVGVGILLHCHATDTL